MSEFDGLVDEWAAEMIRIAAGGVTALQVRNALGGHEDLAHLGDDEHDEVLDRVLDRVHNATITIEP